MAGTAYHMEALRRQRVLERKAEAAKRLEEVIGKVDVFKIVVLKFNANSIMNLYVAT